MIRSRTKSMALAIALVAVLFLGSATPAKAAPPPGMRWSDTVGLTSPRSGSTRTAPYYYTAPSYSYSPYYSYAPAVVSPGVVMTSPAPATIAIRGPDGVVRTYLIEGAMVQQSVPALTSARGANSGIRPRWVISESGVVTYPRR